MRILVVEPGKIPYEKIIDDTLKCMQAIVGGSIQAIQPFKDFVELVCNEESKINEDCINRELPECKDIICGTFFICGFDEDNFISLDDTLFDKYYERFKYPEVFFNNGNKILSEKVPIESCRPSSNNLIHDNGYLLLHQNSIMNCDEEMGDIHLNESDDLMERIAQTENFQKCLLVRAMNVDCHSSKDEIEYFIYSDWQEFVDGLDRYDLKNHVDLGVTFNGGLAIATYGTGYTFNGMQDSVKTLLTVHPTDLVVDGVQCISDIEYLCLEKINMRSALLDIRNKVVKKDEKNKGKEYERR